MAYSIVSIDITNQYSWLSSIKATLEELDVDYWDSLVLNVDTTSSPAINELQFKKEDRTVFAFSVPNTLSTSSGNKAIFYGLEGTAEHGLSNLSTDPKIVITDNAIAITWNNTAKMIIFSKTQTGESAVIGFGIVATGKYQTLTYTDNIPIQGDMYENKTATLTQILPALLSSPQGQYLPHVYFLVRTQSAAGNVFKQITLNDKTFLTNGNVAFKL